MGNRSLVRCAAVAGAVLASACADGGMVSPPAEDTGPSFTTTTNACQTITFNQ